MTWSKTFAYSLTLLLGVPATARSQAPVDTLPCDAWIAALSSGITLSSNTDPLYRVDGCDRPDSLVVNARVQGVQALLLVNDVTNAALNLAYLARDSAWVANSLVPLVVPIIIDKGRPTAVRGQLMQILANTLRPRDSARKAVFNPAPGETPSSSGQCTHGGSSGIHSGSALPQTVVNSLITLAQNMIDDESEVPQLRTAARCLRQAAVDPDR